MNKEGSMLETAIEAARLAGQAVAERYPAAREVTVKGYRDIVTEVDYVAERIVIDTIRSRYPDHTVISEEAGIERTDSRFRWVIDPLDGTTNYARRLPICTVSVGLVDGDDPLAGAIYDPFRGDMFSAERGHGAHLNGVPMAASQVSSLDDAVVSFDWGHTDRIRGQTVQNVVRLAPLCRTVRGLGSAALALAYVAAGWLDCYLNLALKPWDTAAGYVLIREAGGTLTTPIGGPYSYQHQACLATNGYIHDEIVACLRRAQPQGVSEAQ
jgi:myo-inositol-1(or 4)-monophosphatase